MLSSPARTVTVAIALVAAFPVDSAAQAQDKQLDYSRIQWKIGAATPFEEILSPAAKSGFIKGNATLKPKENQKLIVVPISWSATEDVDLSGSIRVGNLFFLASKKDSVPIFGAAIALDSPKPKKVAMWFIPNAGQGQVLSLDIQEAPRGNIAVAFIVPMEWDEIDIGFVRPIGRVKVKTQS